MGVFGVTLKCGKDHSPFPRRGELKEVSRLDPGENLRHGERPAGGSQNFQGSFFDSHVTGYRGFGFRASPRVKPTCSKADSNSSRLGAP